jgi:hypothetical protein
MGLLALCVEFYRVTPVGCSFDDSGNPLSRKAANFPYTHANCSLTCSEESGPFSRMRGGAAGNVDVIPVPRILSFSASMLLAAGFCIPAILSLIFTWDKVLEINWKRRRQVEELDARIEGANITVREMKGINNVVKMFLSVVEIPLFGGIILTIIGVGEANFFSTQMLYMTEPMASIGKWRKAHHLPLLTYQGQWSPIAGTVLAAIGSLYLLWSTSGDDTSKDEEKPTTRHADSGSLGRSRSSERHSSLGHSPAMAYSPKRDAADNALRIRSESPNEISQIPTLTHPESDDQDDSSQDPQADQPTAGRHRVRKWLTTAGNKLGDAAHEKLDPDHDRKDDEMHKFPELPGEILRNPDLEQISRTYSRLREENANSTYSASIMSTPGIESPPPTHDSPRLHTSPSRQPKRRDTLEVPKEAHRRSESHS